MISASRKNDAVISVCQYNDEKSIRIETINQAAEKLIGFNAMELVGKEIDEILPEKIRDNVRSYVEFEDDGADLATVLSKTRRFNILSKEGIMVPVNLKVYCVIAHDKNPRFELLLRDVSLYEKMELMRLQLQNERLAAQQLVGSGIPDTQLLLNCLDMVISFVGQEDVDASFAVMEIDSFDRVMKQYGNTAIDIILSEINSRYVENCREEDTIGYLGMGRIGALLFDCDERNAVIVINRVRNAISSVPMMIDEETPLKITVSVGYKKIMSNDTSQDIITSCEMAAGRSFVEGGNILCKV